MNKEKQLIEEMAITICRKRHACILKDDESCRKCDQHERCLYQDIAYALYQEGYRKQSEGEWLPSPDGIQPIRCSKCNMPAPFVAGENEFGDFEICRYPSRYCHECGAKMKGGEK